MPAIMRILLTNYRSFQSADVRLGRLTTLVGRNGAGKSNFIDAFRFVAESLRSGLPTALERRGGLRSVRHRSGGRPRNPSLAITLDLGEGVSAKYGFRLAALAAGTYEVSEEICEVSEPFKDPVRLEVRHGEVIAAPSGTFPRVDPGRLALPIAAAEPRLARVADALISLRSYSIVPDRLRDLQDPDEGRELLPDGRNAASVLRRLPEVNRAEVVDVLGFVVPGINDVRTVGRGNKLTLEFAQRGEGGRNSIFEALQMSDGTLRILGILLALYQARQPFFLSIEEPEATVHVAASQAIVGVLRARAAETQVLLTTHSADILDSIDISDVRLVQYEDGASIVGDVAEHSKRAVREELFTPGELLRSNGLRREGQSAATPA